MPVLATYFSVRRGRDAFFKFYMKTLFARQMKEYGDKYGIRFLGWYNVAHGWDFDNVILLELPDYATLDKLEADEGIRGARTPRRRVDLPAPPLDVPSRADGSGSRVPRLSDGEDGGRAMDTSRNDLLGEIAADAALERSDFLVQATEQLRRFLDANKGGSPSSAA